MANTYCESNFQPLLEGQFRLATLEEHAGSAVGLWPDGRIAYVNQAWSRFAHANGAGAAVDARWHLGANYFDAIAAPLQPFYRDFVRRAPNAAQSLRPAAHEYECSSADVYRRFAMQVYALGGGAGFVLLHSLLVEQPHDAQQRVPRPADAARYRDANGLVHQCSHCRRVEHRATPQRWDWVPEWVSRAPRFTTHTVCAVCYAYYYSAYVRAEES